MNLTSNDIILYFILLYTFAIVFVITNRHGRRLILEMHSSRDDKFSWVRYTGTFILLFTSYVCLFQLYLGQDINETLILGMLGLAIGGKVAQRSFGEKTKYNITNESEDKPIEENKIPDEDR